MKSFLKKELPLIFLVLLPFVYLFIIWHMLPDQVPMHWNGGGNIDRYGNKSELLIIPFCLPFLMYVLLLIVPKIDPKGKLAGMGIKLFRFRLWTIAFMSVLACYIIYSSKEKTLAHPNIVKAGIGLLFMIFGNYFKTIKPNYFIGIRTPWTLESETVWKQTHRLAGKLWFAGGLLTVLISVFISPELFDYFFYSVIAILVLAPVIYSFWLFKKEMNGKVI